MIGALAARAGVVLLNRLDESARQLQVVGPNDARKVGRVEPRRSRLGAPAAYVARELTEALVRRRFALMPERFTALRTSTTESMSSTSSRW